MDIDSYEYTGEELLNRLDSLKAAQKSTRFYLEIFNERRMEHNGEVPPDMIDQPVKLEHAAKTLRDTHEDLDTLFNEEHHKFPIETVEVGGNGQRTASVTIMEAEAESYEEMVDSLDEIAADLTDGEPGIDYSEAPAPIAMVDFSDELIHTYRKLEKTYEMLDEAGL